MHFSRDYRENVRAVDEHLRVRDNFDILKKTLRIGEHDELTLYFIDGFVKDTVMQKLMMHFSSLQELETGEGAARRFADKNVPYVEVDVTCDTDRMTLMLLSGGTLLLGSSFGMAQRLKDRADARISMGKMTFPHHLARIMALEQIYRAESIQAGSRYHK